MAKKIRGCRWLAGGRDGSGGRGSNVRRGVQRAEGRGDVDGGEDGGPVRRWRLMYIGITYIGWASSGLCMCKRSWCYKIVFSWVTPRLLLLCVGYAPWVSLVVPCPHNIGPETVGLVCCIGTNPPPPPPMEVDPGQDGMYEPWTGGGRHGLHGPWTSRRAKMACLSLEKMRGSESIDWGPTSRGERMCMSRLLPGGGTPRRPQAVQIV